MAKETETPKVTEEAEKENSATNKAKDSSAKSTSSSKSSKQVENVHKGHRSRMRQQFLKDGITSATPPHKVLEWLLFSSIRIADTNVTAHLLMDRFGSLSAVFDAPYEELLKVKGINEASACLIKMIMPIARAYNRDLQSKDSIVNIPKDVSQHLVGQFAGLQHEAVILICLDNAGHVLANETVSDGEFTKAPLSPQKIVKIALQYNAPRILLAHNHPSGVKAVSGEDLSTTREIMAAADGVNIELVDHIIVAGGEAISIRKKYPNFFRRLMI